jgi:hypothetical protein
MCRQSGYPWARQHPIGLLHVKTDDNPLTFYFLMRHRPSGERFAIRFQSGRVTGCLAWGDHDPPGPMEQLDYDADTGLVSWARLAFTEFELVR